MLKKIILCFLVCFFTYNTHSQNIIPNINLKTINGQTISADVTISSTTNALSAGPITVGASATLTVNGFYTIL